MWRWTDRTMRWSKEVEFRANSKFWPPSLKIIYDRRQIISYLDQPQLQLTMNDNQNYFVTRSTSRVLAEPGGKSSTGFLFGGSTAAAKTSPPKKCTVDQNKGNNAVAEAKTTTEEPAAAIVNNDGGKKEEEDAIAACARIKQKNEAQNFSLFGGGGASASSEKKTTTTTSANAFASASTTNSYNVLTDRPTSRVVSSSFVCVVHCSRVIFHVIITELIYYLLFTVEAPRRTQFN